MLLVGDIDRGGVFAQLIGTVDLLEAEERQMVKGLIINKFRGDKTILDPGIAILEAKSGIDVVGVAPYLHIDVEDEDSLSERLEFRGNGEAATLIDIAVIRLPRISNFTDLNVMETIPGVSVRYVKNVQELKDPDMIVLPGSKNTISDLLWMRQNGLEAAILKQAGSGKVVFGICGGYQMLGETLSDPLGLETSGTVRGMDCCRSIQFLWRKKREPASPGLSLQREPCLQGCKHKSSRRRAMRFTWDSPRVKMARDRC